jgi:hypothetical protein
LAWRLAELAHALQKSRNGLGLAGAPLATPSQIRTGRNETAYAQLSPDGKLFVKAMSGKIDRQMNRLTEEAKLELKSFMASELLLKERREGPVQLTADQRRLATTPEPERRPLPVPPLRTEPRRQEPEAPQRARGR